MELTLDLIHNVFKENLKPNLFDVFLENHHVIISLRRYRKSYMVFQYELESIMRIFNSLSDIFPLQPQIYFDIDNSCFVVYLYK